MYRYVTCCRGMPWRCLLMACDPDLCAQNALSGADCMSLGRTHRGENAPGSTGSTAGAEGVRWGMVWEPIGDRFSWIECCMATGQGLSLLQPPPNRRARLLLNHLNQRSSSRHFVSSCYFFVKRAHALWVKSNQIKPNPPFAPPAPLFYVQRMSHSPAAAASAFSGFP
jgi:hypothetical protein